MKINFDELSCIIIFFINNKI